jgi:hypothetical protein
MKVDCWKLYFPETHHELSARYIYKHPKQSRRLSRNSSLFLAVVIIRFPSVYRQSRAAQSVSRPTSPAPRTHVLIKPTSEQFSIEQYTSFGIDRVSGTRVILTPHRACKWAAECSILSAGLTQFAEPHLWVSPVMVPARNLSAKCNEEQLNTAVACDLKPWRPVKIYRRFGRKSVYPHHTTPRHIPKRLHSHGREKIKNLYNNLMTIYTGLQKGISTKNIHSLYLLSALFNDTINC